MMEVILSVGQPTVQLNHCLTPVPLLQRHRSRDDDVPASATMQCSVQWQSLGPTLSLQASTAMRMPFNSRVLRDSQANAACLRTAQSHQSQILHRSFHNLLGPLAHMTVHGHACPRPQSGIPVRSVWSVRGATSCGCPDGPPPRTLNLSGGLLRFCFICHLPARQARVCAWREFQHAVCNCDVLNLHATGFRNPWMSRSFDSEGGEYGRWRFVCLSARRVRRHSTGAPEVPIVCSGFRLLPNFGQHRRDA